MWRKKSTENLEWPSQHCRTEQRDKVATCVTTLAARDSLRISCLSYLPGVNNAAHERCQSVMKSALAAIKCIKKRTYLLPVVKINLITYVPSLFLHELYIEWFCVMAADSLSI